MPKSQGDIRTKILEAVEKQLRGAKNQPLTLDRVAEEAGCAKGLLNYHFRTKSALVSAVSDRMFGDREARWRAALEQAEPELAIRQTWDMLSAEVATGFWHANMTLVSSKDELTVQSVNKSGAAFAEFLCESVTKLLKRMGLVSTVAPTDLGHLVAAALTGFAMQLSNGVESGKVEGAHAALWAGLLALSKPARR